MMQRNRLIVGILAGLLGGIVAGLLHSPSYGWGVHLGAMVVLGALFVLSLGHNIRSAGSGLIWGQAFGLIWWLFGGLTLLPLLFGDGLQWSISAIQANFATLLADVLGFGAFLGLVTACLSSFLPIRAAQEEMPNNRPISDNIIPPLARALLTGGISGVVGAWVFLWGVESAEFFPLVSAITGSDSTMVGGVLHYAIGITIALTFALLFYRDIQGNGSAIIWGMSYGLLWWIIGPLTLMPFLTGLPIEWTIAAAQSAFAPLVAHLLYGAVVGFVYALLNRIWQLLFIDSDPILRSQEGAGSRALRSVMQGQVGGVVGGVLFTVIMVGIGALPDVASLIGARSAVAGFIVHLLIAVTIGSTFGLFFQRVVTSYGTGLGWGLSYGLLWWLLGPLTLFPALLRQPVDWTIMNSVALYPALVGHLLYGVGLGVMYWFLIERNTVATEQTRVPNRVFADSAMWATTLLIVVILPLLLAS
ncbi:MAG: hypothetical protein AAF485_00635 [Chloroflexota bacterium]